MNRNFAPFFILAALLAVAVGAAVLLSKKVPPKPGFLQDFRFEENIAANKKLADERKSGVAFLSAENRYDFWTGEFNLSYPVQSEKDERLREICRHFRDSDAAAKSRMRSYWKVLDSETLLLFSERSAIFAMRDSNEAHIQDGLTAITMLSAEHAESDDIRDALAILYYAAKRKGQGASFLLKQTAKQSEAGIAGIIETYLKDAPADATAGDKFLADAGFAVIGKGAGLGMALIDTDEDGDNTNVNYSPGYPLDQIAVRLAKQIDADKYQTRTITIGQDLPSEWLEKLDPEFIKQPLQSVRGVVTIRADLRPGQSSDYENHFLTIAIADLENEAGVKALLEAPPRDAKTSVSPVDRGMKKAAESPQKDLKIPVAVSGYSAYSATQKGCGKLFAVILLRGNSKSNTMDFEGIPNSAHFSALANQILQEAVNKKETRTHSPK
jgi:hypothetical protein